MNSLVCVKSLIVGSPASLDESCLGVLLGGVENLFVRLYLKIERFLIRDETLKPLQWVYIHTLMRVCTQYIYIHIHTSVDVRIYI